MKYTKNLYFFLFFLANMSGRDLNIHVKDISIKRFKYNIPMRPVRFINNQNDTLTTLPDRLIGGYRIENPNEISILSSRSLMENTIIELNLSIPENYSRFPVMFLLQCHNEIYDIIYEHVVTRNSLFNFGMMMKFVIQISKQSPNELDKVEKLFISTHRYILLYTEIREILTMVIQWFANRLEELLQKTEGSGWVVDRVLNFQICYHKVRGVNRVGSPLVDYPATRCRRFIFNPPSENLFDKMCIEKCITAHILKDKFMLKNKRPNWNYIKRILIKSKNIKRYFIGFTII